MRPFVSRFFFLFGLLLVLTGIALHFEARTTFSLVVVTIGAAVTMIAWYFQMHPKKEDEKEYPEPDPKDFEDEEETKEK